MVDKGFTIKNYDTGVNWDRNKPSRANKQDNNSKSIIETAFNHPNNRIEEEEFKNALYDFCMIDTSTLIVEDGFREKLINYIETTSFHHININNDKDFKKELENAAKDFKEWLELEKHHKEFEKAFEKSPVNIEISPEKREILEDLMNKKKFSSDI